MARHVRANATEDVDLFDTTTTGSISLGAGLTGDGLINIGNASAGAITIRGSNYTGYSDWTPDLKFGGGSVTHTTQFGKYQRRGRIVYYYFKIGYSDLDSNTGVATITGLPITSVSDTDVTSSCFIYNSTAFKLNQTANAKVYGFVDYSSTTIELKNQVEGSTAGSVAALDDTVMGTSGSIYGQGWYWAT